MPIEERFITFNLEEIYKALIIQCERESLKRPPRGDLLSISLNKGGNDKGEEIISLHIRREEDGKEEDIKFVRTFFAHALIFFCQGGGIPLPKAGKKILAVMEDKIVMKITLE